MPSIQYRAIMAGTCQVWRWYGVRRPTGVGRGMPRCWIDPIVVGLDVSLTERRWKSLSVFIRQSGPPQRTALGASLAAR